jgi:hypothetical protein
LGFLWENAPEEAHTNAALTTTAQKSKDTPDHDLPHFNVVLRPVEMIALSWSPQVVSIRSHVGSIVPLF